MGDRHDSFGFTDAERHASVPSLPHLLLVVVPSALLLGLLALGPGGGCAVLAGHELEASLPGEWEGQGR